MPLVSPAMPQDVLVALQTKLHGWAAQPELAPRIMKPVISRGQAAPVMVAGALAIFGLTPGALASGDPYGQARQVGWRFPVTSAGAPPVWIDFAETGVRGGVPMLTSIHQTPFHANLVAALATAGSNAQVTAGTYTAAVLEIPALYQTALWLRDGGAAADLLIPIASQYAEVAVGRVQPAAGYLAILREILGLRTEARALNQKLAGLVTCP